MDIISRAEWGARAPRSRATVSWGDRTEVVVHYSEGPTTQTVRSIQDFHLDGRGWADIGYNFLVDVQGRIYEGRGWLTVGAHAPGHNASGIGVCMIGRDGDATPAALRSIRAVYDEACRRAGRSLAKLGHRDVYATSCPGDQLYAWVKAGMPASGTGGEDVDLSDKVKLHEWIPARWPKDEGLHDKAISVGTALGSGYAFSRIAADNTGTMLALLKSLAEKVGAPVTVDTDAIIAGVLAGLSPDAIADKLAAAIPDDMGEQVAQALAERLAARRK